MPIVLKSDNCTVWLTFEDFDLIKIRVAELTDNEFGKHVKVQLQGLFFNLVSERYEKNNILDSILKFVYSDNDYGVLSAEECRQIDKVIKNNSNSIIKNCNGTCYYSHFTAKKNCIDSSSCLVFEDFKKIIHDCIETNSKIEWKSAIYRDHADN